MPSGELGDLSARARARAELRGFLVANRWSPGAILQEGDLARELGLSKTPVREALLALSEQGLLTPMARIGYRVEEISLRDLADVFAYRELLECHMVQEVAVTRGLINMGHIDSLESPADREHRFHAEIASVHGSKRMEQTMVALLDESHRILCYLDPGNSLTLKLIADHDDILDAILSHDTVLASALLTVHLTHMRESLMAILRQRLREQSGLV